MRARGETGTTSHHRQASTMAALRQPSQGQRARLTGLGRRSKGFRQWIGLGGPDRGGPGRAGAGQAGAGSLLNYTLLLLNSTPVFLLLDCVLLSVRQWWRQAALVASYQRVATVLICWVPEPRQAGHQASQSFIPPLHTTVQTVHSTVHNRHFNWNIRAS